MSGAVRDVRWVFGYGSLMWRPGFDYIVAKPARLFGFHRRLCVYSYHYRGREGCPGVVLGLEPGGSCQGIAFAVAAQNWALTQAYLRERELVTVVYREITKQVFIVDQVQPVPAITYVVDCAHPQYTGRLSIAETARLVRQGHGLSGSCHDYVQNTLAHLKSLNMKDKNLEAIAAATAHN